MNVIKLVFSAEASFKVVVRSVKIGEAILLSTTVLNDTIQLITILLINHQ